MRFVSAAVHLGLLLAVCAGAASGQAAAPQATSPTPDQEVDSADAYRVLRSPGGSLPRGTLVRLRLVTPYRATVTGRLLDADAAGLTLAVGDDGRRKLFARDSVLLLDVADGATSPWSRMVRGARIGFLTGAALTGLAALAGGSQGGDDGPGAVLTVGAGLTAATTLLGAVVVGRALSPRRWRPAAVPERVDAVRTPAVSGDALPADSASSAVDPSRSNPFTSRPTR